jgi:signal transduction histidine kinase
MAAEGVKNYGRHRDDEARDEGGDPPAGPTRVVLDSTIPAHVPSPSDAPAVPSTERVVSFHLPGQWLERLLTVLCQVRGDAPVEESATQILAAAQDLLDDVALGVCIPRAALPRASGDAGGREGSLPGSQPPGQVVVRLARSRSIHPLDSDPTRLFPDLPFERVIAFLPEGATLHAATDDDRAFAEGTPGSLLLERVTQMLASVVENQRGVDRSVRDLRAQVIQSEKLASLGQIAAGIVHELNNPLTTIVAYSDFLRRKLVGRGDPADVERLARINEAAERILRFSRDLTAYSRPANEVPGPVAIHDVIERALVFCEHELEKTGVSVERAFGEVRPVRGVAGQLTQVFVNLFTNAAHAMRGQGGLLTIATSMQEEGVVVRITDDGHGIDADLRPRIFDPFVTTKTDGSGTGLGLSIVRSIVQSHGGTISVDGREPRGTEFHVGLPTAAAPDDAS